MASFSYWTRSQTLCDGTSGEDIGSTTISGSEDVNGSSGSYSYTTEHWYQNTVAGTSWQTVRLKIRHDITVTYESHNLMTVRSRLYLVDGSTSGNAGGAFTWTLVLRPEQGSGSGVSYQIVGNRGSGSFASNVFIGEKTFSNIYPHATSDKNDFYLVNYANGYAGEGDCNSFVDKITTGLAFRNDRDIIYDTAKINSTSCSASSTGLSLSANVNFGQYRPNTKNWVEYQVSKSPMFDNIAWEGSTTGNSNQTQTLTRSMTGLQPNTKYYIRYRASNNKTSNGSVVYSNWATCEAVTLATNKLSDAKSGYWSEGEVTLAVQMGDGYYPDPSTKIYIRKCGTSAWTEKMTRTTKTVAHLTLTGLEAETCYEVQARTTTPAGTYTGNTVSFTTPVKNVATAKFTKIEPEVDSDTLETYSDMCYHYVSTNSPTYITVYYRVKNGFDSTWIKVEDAVEFTDLEGDYCFTIHDLFPNQTVYETYIHTETDGNPWDSPISEFTTPLLPLPENYNCENFEYLTALICQAVKPLYNGNKTIYANPATKELCDPYSENPTLATLWSRILRFDEASACLMCDMLELLKLKNGNYDQYYVGDTGWTQVGYEVLEESELLISSGTVADYIAEKMHEVWHYHGEADYLIGTLAEAPTTGLKNGDTAIVTSENKQYIYNSGSWKVDPDFEPDNFAIYHINNDSDTSYGIVKGGQAYYYFAGTWNNLDADTRALEARVKVLEEAKLVFPQSTTEDLMEIQTNNENFDYTSLPTAKRVICFVVEDTDLPPRGSYRVTFTTGDQATIISDQDVVDGATIQKPTDPVKTGYDFVRWEDQNVPGTAFNFNTAVHQNYDLVAIWTPKTVTVSFNIRTDLGATGVAPTAQTLHYGDPVPLPDDTGFSLPGGTFAGWSRDGVPMTTEDILTGNTTLVALWEMSEFDVTIHPQNGGPDSVVHLSYGNGLAQPSDPTYTDHVFMGWFTAPTGGQQFQFNTSLYGPTDVYAQWVDAKYKITFLPGGCNSTFTQTVNYQALATRPSDPSWNC